MYETEDLSRQDEWIRLRDEYFGDRKIILAANRGPVKFERTPEGELSYQRGAGGLVTALSALAQYLSATWIACARTDEDVEWGQGDIQLANGHHIQVKFLNPSPEAYDGYYNVIANPLLWFIQHTMWDLPRFPIINKKTWDAWVHGYHRVNQLFANAILKINQDSEKRPIVMLQDYHLYLVGNYIRERLTRKNAPTLMHFTHIPWPGPEYWRILPPTMRQSILEGLCNIDILGFQTKDDCLNFIRTIQTYLPRASARYSRQRIWYRNHATFVRDFPISIDVQGLQRVAASDLVSEYREEIERTTRTCSLIVRVDRIDPSKNILRGFLAFEEMLELHPEHQGNVQFLAILVPSRLEVSEYQDTLNELMAAVGHVNAKFGNGDWEPIRIIINENYPRAVAALQCYDVLLVNSIADGMNLVAKEGPVINQRDGVLILSERTGARQQLSPGALVISPCDIYATAEAMHQALTMPDEEKHENAKLLRWMIEREDITLWLLEQLQAVLELGL
ncbi:MAG: trehalose-6-phosphate synthase [Anaerolineales bacterium]